MRYSIEAAWEAGQPIKRTTLVDGGARSPLWRQIIADVTGLAMDYIPDAKGAPLGDAILAGLGTGVITDHRVIEDWKLLNDRMHITEDPTEDEKFYYTPGDRGYNVFSVAGLKAGVAVCYDRHFPEHMRILTLGGAHVIFVPTATTVLHADAWEVEARASAIAGGVFVAHANKVGKEGNLEFFGKSLVVAPRGDIIAQASEDKEEVLVADIDLEFIVRTRDQWPFLRDRRPETYGELLT